MTAALMLAACVKPYEKEYGLEVDSEHYDLGYTAREFPVYVYCSGSWTAAIEPAQDWIVIEEGFSSGKGVGVVRLSVSDNDTELRTATLVLRSGSLERTVTFTQKYNSDRFEITDYEN